MPLADLKDMTLEEIEAFVASLGKEKYRARQIMKWIYQQGASSFEEMTNLSKEVSSGRRPPGTGRKKSSSASRTAC